MIPIYSPGTIIHFSDPTDATTAVGVNPGEDSYTLTCTFGSASNDHDGDKILEVRAEIREFQRAQLEYFNAIDDAMTQAVSRLQNASVKNQSNQIPEVVFAEAMATYTKATNEARTAVFDAESRVLKTINRSGVIVTRWSTRSDVGGRAKIDGIADSQLRRQASSDGYWILDGLRLQFLVIGRDGLEHIKNGGSKTWNISPDVVRILGEVSVTTFQLDVQKSLWFAESDYLLLADSRVQVSVQQLALTLASSGVSEAFVAMFRDRVAADLQAAVSARQRLSNTGFLVKPTWTTDKISWERKSNWLCRSKQSEGWITVLAQSAKMGSSAGPLTRILGFYP